MTFWEAYAQQHGVPAGSAGILPRLTALSLEADGDCDFSVARWPSPHACAFAKLRSLTKLVLKFGEDRST